MSGSAKFLSREDLKADVGLTLNYWSYQHNLSNYTYGSGGYYSPESYLSLAAPVQVDGRYAGWVYRARAAISYTVSEVASAPFYPEDAQLQALAARTALPALRFTLLLRIPSYRIRLLGLRRCGAAAHL